MSPATVIVPTDSFTTAVFQRVIEKISVAPMPLREYYKAAWPIIEPGKPLIETWPVGLMLEYLTAVDMGQITRLLFNVPPRSLKSNTVSVIWPTWSWTQRPWLKWIFASYAASLSNMHSINRRRILQSEWFKERWGDTLQLEDDQNQKMEFQNTARGLMVATSVGGSITGKGGDREVLDDLINPEQAESKLERESAIDFYKHTLMTRLDDKKTGAIVAVEQRLHKLDLSDTLIREGGWTHVKVPAEAPSRIVVKFPLSDRTVVREAGSVICEEREDKATLAKQKVAMGSRAYSAQYQQEPIATDSGYFHVSWWKYYRLLPVGIQIKEWSWDTALEEGQENDYTVGILFAHGPSGTYIEHLVRGRWQTPEVRRIVAENWNARPANRLIIEDSVAGKALAQDFKRHSNLPVLPVRPVGDKVFRANLASPYVESGRVFLPEGAPWIADFFDELESFPQGAHDDQVDAFSQGMNHFYLGPGRPVAALSGQHAASGGLARPDWM